MDYITQQKQQKSHKVAIIYEHVVDIIAMCCKNNITFLIFNVKEYWYRLC